MIQVDIGGHPPIQLGPLVISLVSLITTQFTIFSIFWVVNLQSCFDPLNDVLSRFLVGP